jgi:predicted ATPase
MIQKIQIQNFKSIQKLDLELGQLNVLIGANGAGKSNILESITMGAAALSGKLEQEFLGNRIRVTHPNLMTAAFDETQKSEIELGFTDDKNTNVRFELKYFNKIWNFIPLSIENFVARISEDTLLSKVKAQIALKEFNLKAIIEQMQKASQNSWAEQNGIDKFLIFAPENHFLRNFNEESQIRPIGMRGEGLFSHLMELSREKPALFDKINEQLHLLDWFDGFDMPQDLVFTEKRIQIKDSYLQRDLKYFDQRSANEGFLYLLFYFTLFISDETPAFFAIDNIDNAVNPRLGRFLIKKLAVLAKEHHKQVILTTHNPAILDGLNLHDPTQCLFVVKRRDNGATKIEKIKLKPAVKDKDLKLSELWMRGYLGGLPNHF